jgi:hypothetical protein
VLLLPGPSSPIPPPLRCPEWDRVLIDRVSLPFGAATPYKDDAFRTVPNDPGAVGHMRIDVNRDPAKLKQQIIDLLGDTMDAPAFPRLSISSIAV